MRFLCALFSLVLFNLSAGESNLPPAASIPPAPAGPRIVRQQEGWPVVFELNAKESFSMPTPAGTRDIKLVSFEEFHEPDYWIKENTERKIIAGAKVSVEVNGEPVVLTLRPYQWPLEVQGVRLFVESTRNWAETPQLHPLSDVRKDVRFSAVAAGQPWGPAELRFHIRNYRFRASSYQNTWTSLVPYNKFYYHRGEDMGAIPGRLDVVSMFAGTISKSPLPEGDRRSNSVGIKHTSGCELSYAHMDLETISPKVELQNVVEAGAVLGKTGRTWNGRKVQHADPHLHIQLNYRETTLALWPTLVEAYFREYPDGVVAVAGGYQFTKTGDEIQLDGTRSVPRPGRKITAYQWRLHDGSVVDAPTVRLKCAHGGLYSEELVVKLDDGSEERDYLQVRVYDSKQPLPIARGWIHYTPTRGIKPGTEVLFWNRLSNMKEAQIDFGDGTHEAFSEQVTHAYKTTGLFTVTASGKGPNNEPATVRLRVVVE